MKKRIKTIFYIFVGLVFLFLSGRGVLWYFLGQPLYTPGMVRSEANLRAPLAPPMQSDKPDFWKVENDIELYHFSEGQGRNVLVIHGGPGMPFLAPWLALHPLTEQFKFNYYDQRGSGQSTRPIDRLEEQNFYSNMVEIDRIVGLGAQIADIERIRRILGEKKLIIIGHSFGGFLASLYAAEFPEHVEALILISPADLLMMPQKGDDLFKEVRKRLSEDRHEEYDLFLKNYFDINGLFSKSDADLVTLQQEFGRYYVDALDLPLPKQGEPGGWMAFGMFLSMGRQHDYREALQTIQAPALVLHGAKDLQPEVASRLYSDLLPNAKFAVIENAKHFAFFDQPEVFSALVIEFLEQ